MNCTNCNAQVPDGAAFCPECGQKIEAPVPVESPASVFCANCGEAMHASDSFCENCGFKTEAPATATDVAVGAAAAVAVKDAVKKLNFPTKYLLLGLAAVAVVLVIVIIAALCSGPKVNNYTLYLKDGEIQYAEMPKGKDIIEVTDKLVDSDYISDSDLADASYYLGLYACMSEDGKTLFYPDKIDEDGFTLYCRNINNTKKDPIKIDSDLTDSYYVNDKGDLVTYLKDGKLYQHNLTEKNKIASDVVSFQVSDDGKTILYLVVEDYEDGGELYLKKGSKEPQKLASSVSYLVHVDEDFKEFIYMKEDALYLLSGSKDPEKIASDVSDVVTTYDDGSFYYVKGEEDEVTYWDLIDDDYEDKESYIYESYREWMKESTIDIGSKSLCYYNGKESVTVSESMKDYHACSYQEPVIIISGLENAELPSFSLTSFINDGLSFYDELEEYIDENILYFVVAEDKASPLDLEDIRSTRLTPDGKTLYITADYDSEDYICTLYQISLNGAKIKKTDKLDEDIYAGSLSLYGEDHIIYYKDVDDDEGELYMDGELIDDDVLFGHLRFNDETQCLYYFVDWDSEDSKGSLKYWNGKKTISVKDDVHSYLFTPAGETLFLYDYDTEDCKGALWIQNGKKIQKLDEDVIALIPIY